MSIACLKNKVSAQDRCPPNRTCLLPAEMDYFLRQDARANNLAKDSTEMAGKIEKYKVNETLYKANEQDLKSQVLANKTLAFNYKATAVNCQIEYSKSQDKVKFRGKFLIGSVVLNIGFIALGVVMLKL